MLPRILEPEVMDSGGEASDYDTMDHHEVNRKFVDDLLAALTETDRQMHVLDVGTGTAQIPIELCRRSSTVRVTAIDAAMHMLRLAQRNIDAAGLHQRILAQ